MAEDSLEVGFPVAGGSFKLVGHDALRCWIKANTVVHRLEGAVEEVLLELVHGGEFEALNRFAHYVVDLVSANTVYTTVLPELVLTYLGVPVAAIILPVDVVLAVERGLVVQCLWQRAERSVVRDHRIPPEPSYEAPPAVSVLSIVEVVLVHNPRVWVAKDSVMHPEDRGLLLLRPVAFRPLHTHERDADGFGLAPCDPAASDVAVASFKVVS